MKIYIITSDFIQELMGEMINYKNIIQYVGTNLECAQNKYKEFESEVKGLNLPNISIYLTEHEPNKIETPKILMHS